MGLESVANLLVAGSDLKLVQLLRAAMNGGPGGAAPCGPFGIRPAAVFERRQHIHPEPRIEARKVIHPEPRFEPRPVIHPEPRIEPRPLPEPAPEPSKCCPKHCSPLEPPWKKHPWETPAPPRPQIKLIQRKTDVIHKGSLIDFFI